MILLYHKVALTTPTYWWVSAEAFDRQMADLQAYEVVTLDDYDPANPRHAVITFDGIYDNVFQVAWPILKKWGYPFELFVIGDHIGGDNAFDTVEPLTPFATLDQLTAMTKAGGRLQWHTRSHRRMIGLQRADLEAEILTPDSLRAGFSDRHWRWFAYPHGDHDAVAVDVVKETYAGALSCVAGNDEDRYQLNRITVDETSRFRANTVSVIVANYNYGPFLAEAIESVLAQTQPPHEILVIDDCSSDESRAVAARYADRVRLEFNERNLGIVANFNKAVSLTSGDYVAFLGADNTMRADYVERCQAALDRNPKAAIAYTDMTIFGARSGDLAERVAATQIGRSVAENWPIFLWQFPEPTPETLARMHDTNFIHGSSMYRRRAFDEAGGYRAQSGPEDHDLFRRMLDAGWECVRVAAPVIAYRQHSPGQANTVLALQGEAAHWRQHALTVETNFGAAEAARVRHLAERDAAVQQGAALRAERDALLQSVEEARVQNEKCQRQIESLVRELADAREIIAHLQRRVQILESTVADLNGRLAATLGSTSWHITAPLRWAGHLARGQTGEAMGGVRAAVGGMMRRVARR